jgi:hypothetical protein
VIIRKVGFIASSFIMEYENLSVCGDKRSADSDAARKFVEEFTKLISDENLTAEQICNADETGLFWQCLHRRTLAAGDEDKAFGVKESKERVMVLACTNAAGTAQTKANRNW